ncbi:MAG: glycosyltransferase family 8 protein [Pirellulaceae bacterium]|nr:glycosyltransferase family 8 protein [Pirellulaceae bacterium]
MSLERASTCNFAEQEIVVVSGADERYAMPLAVTIRSAIDCLQPQQRMRLFILDGGISEHSKERLLRSWNDPRMSVSWLEPNIDLVRDLPVSDHISLAAYLRLMLPKLLPLNVTRAIYLDADMLVRKNLVHLWNEPQEDYSVLAVQDYAAPFIDASKSLTNFEQCNPNLAAAFPVANYRELGIPENGMYFNSGLLVINIAQWRSEDVADKVFDCLRQHRAHVLWWDQYALNVVLAGKWRCLDHRWNQGAHIFTYPDWRESPFDWDQFKRLKSDPWIIHYCSPSKPWQYFCDHPFARDFRRFLKRTEWRDFRAERPERFLKTWWDYRYKLLKKRFETNIRWNRYRRAA